MEYWVWNALIHHHIVSWGIYHVHMRFWNIHCPMSPWIWIWYHIPFLVVGHLWHLWLLTCLISCHSYHPRTRLCSIIGSQDTRQPNMPIYCMCCTYIYIYDIYIQASFLCSVATLLVVQVSSNMTNLVRYLTNARWWNPINKANLLILLLREYIVAIVQCGISQRYVLCSIEICARNDIINRFPSDVGCRWLSIILDHNYIDNNYTDNNDSDSNNNNTVIDLEMPSILAMESETKRRNASTDFNTVHSYAFKWESNICVSNITPECTMKYEILPHE